MRRREKEIKTWSEMEEIIQQAQVCRLGLWDGQWPYIVPLHFGYREATFYFHSAHEGRKIEILKKYPRAAFEIELSPEIIKGDFPCLWSTKYRSICGEGEVSFLESRADKAAALRIIMAHYGEMEAVFPETQIDRVAVFQLKITRMTGKKAGF